MKRFINISLVAILSSVASLFLYDKFMLKKTTSIKSPPVKVIPSIYSYEQETVSAVPPTDFVEAASKSINAVVHVKNTSSSRGGYSALDFFFNRQAPESRIGTGSGVIVSPDGYIITNNHVIENATKIEVTTNNNKVYEAKLIGTDPVSDIAVLKIESKEKFLPVRFGDSDKARIGDWVIAIGNPFGLGGTVTSGIISARNRSIGLSRYEDYIQTHASNNSGS